jgi:hypothetical protein
MYDAGNNSWLNVAPMLSERQLVAAVTWNGKVVFTALQTSVLLSHTQLHE